MLKINYKGSKRVMPWEYVCEECKEHVTIEHTREDDMHHRHCDHCDGLLLRYINKVPTLGADYHDALLTRNIGWDL